MIEGTDHMTYIGMLVRSKSAHLVFAEGILTVRQSRRGWGVMKHAELLRILGDSPPLPEGSEDPWTPDGSTDRESDSESDHDPASTDSTSSGSRSRSGSPSPRVLVQGEDDSGGPDLPEHDEGPRDNELGWCPSRTPVQLFPVSAAGWSQGMAAVLDDMFDELLPPIHAGQLAPHGPTERAVGMFLCCNPHGEDVWLAFPGVWHPVTAPEHARVRFTEDVARQLVAASAVAEIYDLAPVLGARTKRFVGHVGDEQRGAFVFRGGLLVRAPEGDPVNGWIPLERTDHMDLVSTEVADVLRQVCSQPDANLDPTLWLFQHGMLRPERQDHFVALLWSDEAGRYQVVDMPAPDGFVEPFDEHGLPDPRCLPESQARMALEQARVAPAFDLQSIEDYQSLSSGEWDIPAVLGALRLLSISNAQSGLLRDTWHATLCPPLASLLNAWRPQEAAWRAQGVIRQSIDGLLDLMHRDVRLRRREVSVMWPVALLGHLFDTLAPKVPVAIDTQPQPLVVEKLLSSQTTCLLLFKAVGWPRQSAVVVWNGQCWSNDQWISLNALRERTKRSFGKTPLEQLVAVVHLP